MKCNILLQAFFFPPFFSFSQHLSEDETNGKTFDSFYRAGVYFSSAVPFLSSGSLIIYLGWHLGFKTDQLSRQQSEEDVRKKIFLQHNFGGI